MHDAWLELQRGGSANWLALLFGLGGLVIATASLALAQQRARAAFATGVASVLVAITILVVGAAGIGLGRRQIDAVAFEPGVGAEMSARVRHVGYAETRSCLRVALVLSVVPLIAGALAAFVEAARRKSDASSPTSAVDPFVLAAASVALAVAVALGEIVWLERPLPRSPPTSPAVADDLAPRTLAVDLAPAFDGFEIDAPADVYVGSGWDEQAHWKPGALAVFTGVADPFQVRVVGPYFSPDAEGSRGHFYDLWSGARLTVPVIPLLPSSAPPPVSDDAYLIVDSLLADRFVLRWMRGFVVITSIDVPRAGVAPGPSRGEFPALRARVESEWKSMGNHRDPADKKFDRAILRVRASTEWVELIGLVHALVDPTREVYLGGPHQAPVFVVGVTIGDRRLFFRPSRAEHAYASVMKVTSERVDIGNVHAVITRPEGTGRYPAVIAYSDIFQLTEPHLRIVTRLAGHGFVVVAPELYGGFEPKGTVLDFDADRQRALDDSAKVSVAELDADVRTVVDHVLARPDVTGLGVIGWCFGGHVAFRAAFDPRVKSAACCYPTGVHDGKLGTCDGVATKTDSIGRASEIKGDVLLVWGRRDPHIPAEGRAAVHRALDAANVRFEARLFDAEHTFMRDAGARHDPEATDRAFAAIVDLFGRTLA